MKYFVYTLSLLVYLYSLYYTLAAEVQCSYLNNCQIPCTNVENTRDFADTDWFLVPIDDGSCYFHNVVTRHDTNINPFE